MKTSASYRLMGGISAISVTLSVSVVTESIAKIVNKILDRLVGLESVAFVDKVRRCDHGPFGKLLGCLEHMKYANK